VQLRGRPVPSMRLRPRPPLAGGRTSSLSIPSRPGRRHGPGVERLRPPCVSPCVCQRLTEVLVWRMARTPTRLRAYQRYVTLLVSFIYNGISFTPAIFTDAGHLVACLHLSRRLPALLLVYR
jgi:hypothetical protein